MASERWKQPLSTGARTANRKKVDDHSCSDSANKERPREQQCELDCSGARSKIARTFSLTILKLASERLTGEERLRPKDIRPASWPPLGPRGPSIAEGVGPLPGGVNNCLANEPGLHSDLDRFQDGADQRKPFYNAYEAFHLLPPDGESWACEGP